MSIHVAALDDWGAAAAGQDGPEPLDTASWPPADLVVVAAAREDIDLLQHVDERCFRWRRPWAALLLTASDVRLGPVVVPGRSACYQCFHRRRLQHDPEGLQTAAMLRGTGPTAAHSVAGYLPSDVLLARALLRAADDAVGTDFGAGLAPGDVIRFDFTRANLRKDHVVGVHGCPRCGPTRDRAADTWLALSREVQHAG